MSELQTVSMTIGILTACISVVIGVVNQILSRRRTEKTEQLSLETRQAELFMQLYDRFNDKDFAKQYTEILFQHKWTDFDDWMQKYGPMTNLDVFSSWMSVAVFFEGIGVLIKRKLIDISLVDDLLSSAIIMVWEKIEPIAKEYRVRFNRPQLWEWFEYLYTELKRNE